jgi:hypothetical protein
MTRWMCEEGNGDSFREVPQRRGQKRSCWSLQERQVPANDFPVKIMLIDLLMGADAPIPPFAMPSAAPAGALPRRPSIIGFPTTCSGPAVPYRGLEMGSPPITTYISDFHASGVNSRLCAFLQNKFG